MAGARLRGVKPEMRDLIREVTEHPGWEVDRPKGGHIVLSGPQGKVICSSSASDRRAIMNIKRDLAHKGLDLRGE